MTKAQQKGLFVLMGAAQGLTNPETIEYVTEDGSGPVYGRALGSAWNALPQSSRELILKTLGNCACDMFGVKPR